MVTLCMALHSSHPLQPLDMACFSPVKKAYYKEVDSWSRHTHTQIKKQTFSTAIELAY
jgi:hypothetical protein